MRAQYPHNTMVAHATGALRAAQRGDHDQVIDSINRLYATCGQQGVVDAIMAWIDTYLARVDPDGDAAVSGVRLGFRTIRDGRVVADTYDADCVPAHIAWAGRMMTARAANDRDMYCALLASMPEQDAGLYVSALLYGCATGLNYHPAVSFPPPPGEPQ